MGLRGERETADVEPQKYRTPGGARQRGAGSFNLAGLTVQALHESWVYQLSSSR